MFHKFQPNPDGRSVGDCAIRMMCAAFDIPWEDAYSRLALEGFAMSGLPNDNDVFGRYLLQHGFTKHLIPDSCVTCYTVDRFAADHPTGVYVLCVRNHVVCVKNGEIWDSWNSGNEIVLYYFQKEDEQK